MYKEEIIAAHKRIAPFIHNTPVLTSRSLDDKVGARLFFKCENFQRAGSFKMRGAVNALLGLGEKRNRSAVVTHSSGNFAQSLSLAAQITGHQAYIVMPKNAPKVKKQAAQGYGGTLIECEPNLAAREQKAQEVIRDQKAVCLHPSNHWGAIFGHATAAKELIEREPDLDYIFVPVGGGGLLAGTALSAITFSRNCKVIGGEPFGADDAFHSLRTGKITANQTVNTIADGLRTQLGDKNFPIIEQYVQGIVRVEDEEIIAWMKTLWQGMKVIVETSSAVALAAAFRHREYLQGKKVGIILSGGNVDLERLPWDVNL